VDVIHEELRRQMREHDAEPDDVRYCPHLPDGDDPAFTADCECRKPKGGMLEEAARQLGVDLKRSFMIGDKYTDVQCGLAVGPRAILVRSGRGAESEKQLPTHAYSRPYHISDDLAAAAKYIINGK
jgi:D-glycero-D-manno-heptose 1,7-bisphosphate phosphatase